MFKLYDVVWVMDNNKPTKKLIVYITERMHVIPRKPYKIYGLINVIDEMHHFGRIPNNEIPYNEADMAFSKEELLTKLLNL